MGKKSSWKPRASLGAEARRGQARAPRAGLSTLFSPGEGSQGILYKMLCDYSGKASGIFFQSRTVCAWETGIPPSFWY